MNFDKNNQTLQEYGKFANMPFMPFPYMRNLPRNVESYRLNAIVEDGNFNIMILANPENTIGELNRKSS